MSNSAASHTTSGAQRMRAAQLRADISKSPQSCDTAQSRASAYTTARTSHVTEADTNAIDAQPRAAAQPAQAPQRPSTSPRCYPSPDMQLSEPFRASEHPSNTTLRPVRSLTPPPSLTTRRATASPRTACTSHSDTLSPASQSQEVRRATASPPPPSLNVATHTPAARTPAKSSGAPQLSLEISSSLSLPSQGQRCYDSRARSGTPEAPTPISRRQPSPLAATGARAVASGTPARGMASQTTHKPQQREATGAAVRGLPATGRTPTGSQWTVRDGFGAMTAHSPSGGATDGAARAGTHMRTMVPLVATASSHTKRVHSPLQSHPLSKESGTSSELTAALAGQEKEAGHGVVAMATPQSMLRPAPQQPVAATSLLQGSAHLMTHAVHESGAQLRTVSSSTAKPGARSGAQAEPGQAARQARVVHSSISPSKSQVADGQEAPGLLASPSEGKALAVRVAHAAQVASPGDKAAAASQRQPLSARCVSAERRNAAATFAASRTCHSLTGGTTKASAGGAPTRSLSVRERMKAYESKLSSAPTQSTGSRQRPASARARLNNDSTAAQGSDRRFARTANDQISLRDARASRERASAVQAQVGPPSFQLLLCHVIMRSHASAASELPETRRHVAYEHCAGASANQRASQQAGFVHGMCSCAQHVALCAVCRLHAAIAPRHSSCRLAHCWTSRAPSATFRPQQELH